MYLFQCFTKSETKNWNRQMEQTRGGHSHWKGVWGCAAVMIPFFQASRRSLAYQFTVNAPLLCPLFSIFRIFLHFQPCFGQNCSSLDPNFSKFSFTRPVHLLWNVVCDVQHHRPHFTVDERIFMVLKYTKTGNVLETIRFQKQFPNQRTPWRQTIMKNCNKYVQYD